MTQAPSRSSTDPQDAGAGAPLGVQEWGREVRRRVGSGARLAGLYGSDHDQGCRLTAILAEEDRIEALTTVAGQGADGAVHYASLSTDVPAAFWYERALHDLSGAVPDGHPRLDPLLLDRASSPPPRPGATSSAAPGPVVGERPGPVDVAGHGMFTLPLGPVRSGVLESIEFLLETPGEDIPHLTIRPHYKHRGIAKQFEGRTPQGALLVAERVEGISSVAHALAFCHAIEDLAGAQVPRPARLARVVLAELERMANHLDVTQRLADAAALAVGSSRFGWHKESVMRLTSSLCGSRFGRGTIGIGGLNREVVIDAATLAAQLRRLGTRIRSDIAALEGSASFVDRLRTTGPLSHGRAVRLGAVGPIARASAVDNDVRRMRPYDGYLDLHPVPVPTARAGDALARTRVRWEELMTSIETILAALDILGTTAVPATDPTALPAPDQFDGFALGSAESAQGEVVHAVELSGGLVRRCFARSASFHDLVLFHDVFAGDIFTDLPFIEASFGLSYAGVAM